jgi:GTPase SAR1 family protein
LLCYSVVDPTSYANVQAKWAPELKKHCPKTPIILVGTKIDAREDDRALRELKARKLNPILHEEGLALKKAIGAVDYIECSAKTGKNLKLVFTRCIENVLGVQGHENEHGLKRRSKHLIDSIFSKKVLKCTIM